MLRLRRGDALMTDRIDLTPDAKGFRRVSYTCRYGFVDWDMLFQVG